jgi:uncharacterized protein (TIGR03083 family)
VTPPVGDLVLLDALRASAEGLGGIDEDLLDTPVETCPGWSVGELVGHLGEVHRWATALVTDPHATVRRRDVVAPRGADVVPWYAEGVTALLDTLSGFEGPALDVMVRTWAGERPRRWWLRRLTHETVVHRWDARHALSAPGRLDPQLGVEPQLAVDAIDEIFENLVPARFALAGFEPRDETWHLHATDASGEWLVHFTDAGVEVLREHTKGDCATRGPAEALALLLWGRLVATDAALEVFGDTSIVERWHDAARF